MEIFFRLWLQTLFPGVVPRTVVRVRSRGYIVVCMSGNTTLFRRQFRLHKTYRPHKNFLIAALENSFSPSYLFINPTSSLNSYTVLTDTSALFSIFVNT